MRDRQTFHAVAVRRSPAMGLRLGGLELDSFGCRTVTPWRTMVFNVCGSFREILDRECIHAIP